MADVELTTISGADLEDFKKALGAIFYMTPISSQTVSSPVDHIDLDLPTTGFNSFLCTMASVAPNGGAGNAFGLNAALSADGSTFLTDLTHFDTYTHLAASSNGIPKGADTGPSFASNYDSMARLMPNEVFTYIYTGSLWINPGGVGIYPSLTFEAFFRTTDSGGHFSAFQARTDCTLFPEATVPPTLVRHAKVRLLDAANTDPNVPTEAGTAFAAGSVFNLYGVPS